MKGPSAVILALLSSFAPACVKKDGAAIPTTTSATVARNLPLPLDAAPQPDALGRAVDASTLSEGMAFAPLTKGKTLPIRGLDIVPLEATVPPKFKLTLEGPGEDFGDSAHLQGPGSIDIAIWPKDSDRPTSLGEQRKIMEGLSAHILGARELSPGFVLIDEAMTSYAGLVFDVFVSRPNLDVFCEAQLHRLEDAELAASICLSLRPTKRTAIDLTTIPPLAPLREGKLVRVEGLKTVPLLITVPPKFRYQLGPSVSASGPDATFYGPNQKTIVVGPPRDFKFLSLTEQKEEILKEHPSVMIVRADESPEGFVVIGYGAWSGGEYDYDVTVSKPALNVVCGGSSDKRLSYVEMVAAACLSLHAASEEKP